MEFIGLFISSGLFFALSVVIGCMYGGAAWLILRSRGAHRALCWGAAFLPPLFAAYMAGCGILFALLIRGEGDRIFFGDIYERLPNGYSLTAMAKMWDLDLASIREDSGIRGVRGVGSLAVDGRFIFGGYGDKRGYFIFDTRNGTNLNVATAAELDSRAGHRIQLTEAFSFRSSEGSRDF